MQKRLLIIDDNKEVVEVVSEVLSDLFDIIDGANTVDEAERAVSDNAYDLIFLDINLENRNGAEVIQFLLKSRDNPNLNTPFVIISGIITPQFVDRYQKRFAGILMKPFNHEDVRKMAADILGGKNLPDQKPLEETPLDEIPYLKCELPFPIVQIDRTADNYIFTHIGMLINISTAICLQQEWNTDKTLEKFVYAAYLHDMALAHRPDLARIDTFSALELRKETLTAGEYKIVFEHPNIAANSITGMVEIPQDVAMIIRQHHELPKETGFPTKCGHQKIAPLSVVFIIAHDLTDHILANPNWDMESYILKSRSKFRGSHFIKIFHSLSDIE